MDETMSQDAAFTSEGNVPDTFIFEDEQSAQDSQSKNDNTQSDSDSGEDKDGEVEERRVPYSRFKRVIEEREEASERMKALEERLHELESNRSTSDDYDDPMPPEWERLYGNSEASREAWNIQLRRETQLTQQAVEQALGQIERQQAALVEAVEENEELIENSLELLQESLGRKFTAKQEEEILTIVDEFSPTGPDGKYVTLFPFDKAYEIYALRSAQKGRPTHDARRAVAELAGGSSEGDTDSSVDHYRRGWDNWREAI